MHPLLREFLEQLALSQDDINAMGNDLVVEDFPKGTVLLEQGEVSNDCYFVLKGCVRQHAVDFDGKENTVNFFTEMQTAMVYKSYSKRVPSEYSLSCTEDSVLLVGDFFNEAVMFEKYPSLVGITREFMEENLMIEQEDKASFVTASPKERYLNLVKTRPELIERVPQHQLASYLGMTAESLSRIKKRVSQD